MFLVYFLYLILCELLALVAAPLFDFPLIFFITASREETSMTSSINRVPRKTVAIVGTGSAGIGALWALNRTHHDVYVYEAADRLGGHTNTVTWKRGKYQALVDTGFIVLNTATYRMFFDSVHCHAARMHIQSQNVEIANTDMQPILSTF
jgi:hypothetical protein